MTLRRLGLVAAWAALPALCAATGTADVLVLESGKTHLGVATRVGEEVRLNTFGCSVAAMTLGVKTYRARDVKRIDPDEDEPWIHARLDEIVEGRAPEAVAELASLAGLARRKGYRDLAKRLAEEALARGSTDAELMKLAGGAERWAARRRGDVRVDAALASRVGALLTRPRAAERATGLARLAAETSLTLSAATVERSARALWEPVGVLEEIPLGWTTKDVPQGRFTLYVPPDLHPLEPAPLVVALHGGGVIQANEKTRLLGGTGRDMLRLLSDGAERKGWLLLCPTALEAPWDTPRNRAFLEAVLAEVQGRWNVDLARVHLIGLGEGGEGAWVLGSTWGERFASVSAAAAPTSGLVSSLVSRQIGVWIGHGEADERFPVDPVRKTALRLQEQGAAFVYCELPKEGHGLTADAERDWYRYVAGRRNPRAKDAWPVPSFALPVGEVERAARGDPAAAHGGTLAPDAPVEVVWAALAAGGAEAEPAAERLLELRPADVATRARALLTRREAPSGARTQEAWLLGRLGDGASAPALGDVLRAAQEPTLRMEAARALGRLADPLSAEDLRFALEDVWSTHQRTSFPANRVPFAVYERVVRLACEVVEALARVGRVEEVGPEIEQVLVLGLLRDARAVEPRRGPGGEPQVVRRDLVRSVARAYATLRAEKTLVDMLRSLVKKDAAALDALVQGLREGVPR
jgi:poly(3-hydroxybutyrate) depolymerase